MSPSILPCSNLCYAVRTHLSTLRTWLASEPFTLTLSSGFFGFFAHAGVLSVLEEERLLPRRVSGSSAGALVNGLWAAGVPARRIVDELLRVDRRDFWDPAVGPGLLEGRLFGSLLERLLPVRTFGECRVPLSVSVFDVGTLRTRALESGELVPALRASCAVPVMFHPVRHDGRFLYDGGIMDCPGLAGVAHGERVLYHHLPSRVPFPWMHGVLGRGLPTRRGLVALVVDSDRHASTPFRLDQGARAIDVAARAARDALDCPVSARASREH